MTTIKDLETNAERLRNELNSLENNIKALKDKEANNFWEPLTKDDKVFFLNNEGDVFSCSFSPWDRVDTYQKKIGSFFQTKEEAIKHRERLYLTQELRKFAKGYKFTYDRPNFFIRKEFKGDGTFYFEYTSHAIVTTPGTIYFQTGELAKKAIDTFGDRLNVLFD